MNKGLDLIRRQQPEIIDGYPTGNIYIGVTKEELTELEQELKLLELIKKHLWFYEEQKRFIFVDMDEDRMTDLLKEVLLWD